MNQYSIPFSLSSSPSLHTPPLPLFSLLLFIDTTAISLSLVRWWPLQAGKMSLPSETLQATRKTGAYLGKYRQGKEQMTHLLVEEHVG